MGIRCSKAGQVKIDRGVEYPNVEEHGYVACGGSTDLARFEQRNHCRHGGAFAHGDWDTYQIANGRYRKHEQYDRCGDVWRSDAAQLSEPRSERRSSDKARHRSGDKSADLFGSAIGCLADQGLSADDGKYPYAEPA